MNLLFIPSKILAEKLSYLEKSIMGLAKYPKGSIGADFRDLLKLHYNDLKELQNYTLTPPGVQITSQKETQ